MLDNLLKLIYCVPITRKSQCDDFLKLTTRQERVNQHDYVTNFQEK